MQKNQLKEAQVAASALGTQLQLVEAREAADFDRALSDMTKGHAGALTVLGDSILLFTERGRLVELVAKNWLPAVYNAREFVVAGGLMSYSVSFPDLFRRRAAYVDKILTDA